MDILELSRKMEGDLLDSRPNKLLSFCTSSVENLNSPRLTRSQTHRGEKRLIEDIQQATQPRKNQKKVDEVSEIYLNKKSKVVHKNLETIYEDPIWKRGNTLLLGTSKLKRSIYLDREFRITSKQKSKLRKMKIKRLGKRIKNSKISDEEFKKRMLQIENFLNENDVEIANQNNSCDVDFIDSDDNDKDFSSLGNGAFCDVRHNESFKIQNEKLVN